MFVFLILSTSSFLALDAFCPFLCSCSVKDRIVCSGTSITDIAALSIPYHFTYICIKSTQDTKLTNTSFQEMPVTSRLFFEGNHFSLIESGVFQKFPLLKSLKLTNNAIRSLPSGIFHRIFNLEQLFLDQNQLSDLDPYMFQDLKNLSYLSLNRNLLRELPAGLLDHLVNLRHLNLSRNKLTSLPKYIFNSLFKLKTLFLYNNILEVITPGMFDNLTELEELRLYANEIVMVDKEAFYNLPKLNMLMLHKNRIEMLPERLFLHLTLLTSLTFYENPLTELPNVLFGKMEKLDNLWLYNTNLLTIPNFVFSNLTNLKLLILTQNPKLQSLPKESFSGLSKLEELSLHSNGLKFLGEGLFQNLQQLQILSLYNNVFEDLPDDLLHPLVNLEIVYLNNSKFRNLPGTFFKTLTKLKNIRLDGNPWACDCRLKDFKLWFQENVKIIQNSMSIFCEHPSALKGKPVLHFDAPVCSHTTIATDYPYVATITSALASATQNIRLSSEVTRTPTILLPDHSRHNLTSVIPSHVETTQSSVPSKDDLSIIDHSSGWSNNDSSSTSLPSHMGTTHTFKEDLHTCLFRKLFGFCLTYGKIIFHLIMVTAALQVVLIVVTCFIMQKIRKIHTYFSRAKEPVELQRILIPISLNSIKK
ncbi:platelet glycoprotein V [Aquarana catesbeiana]|uniref:platelet glycoprotein V n=1 Tax=Aquarana catesbeiana TaxID=8400 RepID=UPI003CC9A17A